MASSRVWLGTILGSLLALAPLTTRGAEPLQVERPIYFEVTLVEVPAAALKKAGIDVAELTKLPPPKDGSPKRPELPVPGRAGKSHVDSETLPAVVQSLVRDKAARVLARPRMGTISGRKAALQVGDAIDLQATPQAIDEKSIKLEYSLKFSEPLPQTDDEKRHGIPPGKRSSFSSMGVTLQAGKTTAVTGLPVKRPDARGEMEEIAIVTLLLADFKPPADIREAARPQPSPTLEGRYQEVEAPNRR